MKRNVLRAGIFATMGALVFGCNAPQAEAEDTLDLPASVAGLMTQQDALERFDRQDDTVGAREQAVESLSRAYGGARVASQAYADDSLMMLASVYAVEAESPGLWSPQDNDATAERLGFPEPPEQVLRQDDAECLVRVNSLASGSTGPTRPDSDVLRCQVVRGGVTVLLPAVPPTVDVDLAFRIVLDSMDHLR